MKYFVCSLKSKKIFFVGADYIQCFNYLNTAEFQLVRTLCRDDAETHFSIVSEEYWNSYFYYDENGNYVSKQT